MELQILEGYLQPEEEHRRLLLGTDRSLAHMAPPFPTLNKPVKAVYPVLSKDLPDLGEDHSFETMAVWNRKGGVAKTTVCHALGFAYALKGRRVLMVDADPHCDLSCLLLQEWVRYHQSHAATAGGVVDYNLFFDHKVDGCAKKNHLRSALAPVIQFAGSDDPLGIWGPADVTKIELQAHCNGALFLLPGHRDISAYEDKVTHAYASNLMNGAAAPGAWNKLIALTARMCGADIVIVDCNPHVGALNMHIVLTSNYLLIPCTPDFHSHNAIKELPHILRRWVITRSSARNTRVHSEELPPDLKIPGGNPLILGASIMEFTRTKGLPARIFRHWLAPLGNALRDTSTTIHGMPALVGMAGDPDDPDTWPSTLVNVPDFSSLGALSHYYGLPVLALGPNLMCTRDARSGAMKHHTAVAKTTMSDTVMKSQTLFKHFLQEIGSKVGSGPFLVVFDAENDCDGDTTHPDLVSQQAMQDFPEHDNESDAAPEVGHSDEDGKDILPMPPLKPIQADEGVRVDRTPPFRRHCTIC